MARPWRVTDTKPIAPSREVAQGGFTVTLYSIGLRVVMCLGVPWGLEMCVVPPSWNWAIVIIYEKLIGRHT